MKENRSGEFYGYVIRLSPLTEEDGGGWLAEVPQLEGCMSDGETLEEALANVKDAIRGWLEVAQEDGKEIPPPETASLPEYSGKFTLRIPRALHRFLVIQAEREGVSLNQYVAALISYNAALEAFREQSAAVMDKSPGAKFVLPVLPHLKKARMKPVTE